MKVAKVLKLKNHLADDIAQLKDLLGKQNVRSVKQKFDYDTARLKSLPDRVVQRPKTVAHLFVPNKN